MNGPILILDCNFLAHRAFHSMPNLTAGDVSTAVPFGFLRELVALQDRFQAKRCVFCFDHGPFLRQQASPIYKANRLPKTKEEESVGKAIRCQIAILMRHLDDLGFANIFHAQGYEADDLIASVCQHSLPANSQAVIVASDKDLYQLLNQNVSMYDPRKKQEYRKEDFITDWLLHPRQWAKVKAIAGCPGDGVRGINGVAEKTATKYLRGELKHGSAAQRDIDAGWQTVVKPNLGLVRLPYAGCPTFDLQEDDVTVAKWQRVCDGLQLKALRDDPPACAKRK